MSEKLKPCPFCGGEATLIKEDRGILRWHQVRCNDCRASNVAFLTEEEAIEAWNNRPNPWHTGTPTYRGRYLVSNGYDTSISYFDGKEFIKDFLGFPDVGDIVKWQKINL